MLSGSLHISNWKNGDFVCGTSSVQTTDAADEADNGNANTNTNCSVTGNANRSEGFEWDEGNGQLEYVQREVYAGSERIEQFTDRSRGGYERLLYVHEDLQGNTRYYTKANGQSFAELTYDAWGMPESSNPIAYMDPNGLWVIVVGGAFAAGALISVGEGIQLALDIKTGDIGVFSFSTWGGSSPALGKGPSVSIYFTENIENLAGLSYAYGAGINGPVIGGIPFKGSLEVSYGWASDGSLVRGITFSGAPMDLIPVEFHAVEVHAQQLLSGNLLEMTKNVADSIISVFKKAASYFNLLIGCM